MRFRRKFKRFRRRRRVFRRKRLVIPRPFHQRVHNVQISHSMTLQINAIIAPTLNTDKILFGIQDFPNTNFSNSSGNTPLPQWDSFSHVFDSYRVNAIRIKYMPRVTQNFVEQDTYGPSIMNPTLYTIVDYNEPGLQDIADSTTNSDYGTPNAWARFKSCKVGSVFRPFTRFIKCRRNIIVDPNTTNLVSVSNKGYQETERGLPTQVVALGFEGLNGDFAEVNSNLGEVHVTWYISFKDIH